MRIQHNVMAMNAYRNYNKNTSALSKNLEKLSSGYKINRAGDDAAGLAISEKMRAQITGLSAAQKNVKDGISLVKTAEGAMQEIHDMLNRMDYLATQSANGTYDDPVDRLNLQKEVDALRSEINRIADSANFNGIQLLDGSLDATGSTDGIKNDSAISNIQSTAASAKGASPAFEATYVTNRPKASTTQTNAVFSISLDDLGFTGSVKKDDEFKLQIGDAELVYKVKDGDTVADAAALATKLAGSGYKMDTTNNVEFTSGNGVDDADADLKDTTAKWDEKTGGGALKQDGSGTAGEQALKIGGHWYKIEVDGTNTKQLNFTQVDYTGTSGENIDPNFEVKVSYKAAADNETKMTGTVNDHVQKTTSGIGIGTSHQAQVDLAIDFSKIKDGDKLTIGGQNYVFKVGKNGTATKGSAADTALIDLSQILKEDADFSDEAKLNRAMTVIAQAIDGAVTDPDKGSTDDTTNAAWSAGNFGIDGTVGTISLQSKSDFADDTKKIGAGSTTWTSGTDDALEAINMTTEASVMRQFYSERGKSAAVTSFDVDVTKIKNGDQFTIDGVKFEFYSGTGNMKDDKATKIDLTSLGDIEDGSLAASQTTDVMGVIQTKVQAALTSDKYTVTTEGGTLKITSVDNENTGTDESKVSAKVELSEEAYGGKGLTLQIGDTADDFNQLSVNVGDMHTNALKIDEINIGNQEDAKAAIASIKDAINYVSGVRGDLGAVQNRLEHTANNLSVMAENIQDAEATIRDTDVAEEMMAYTKNNILIQSAQAMLAQANAVPQGVLQLLG